ncbi:E3 ubiquitin-protein ligase rfwd3.S-like isoform X2 [Prorops nasuta]|uniref:E3 ubiquitin-protein ligase rfwd3.S-like isoform X2 n=1 Tax=Prorops nasuta TaxID=863751 RepID=UPI0034CF6802
MEEMEYDDAGIEDEDQSEQENPAALGENNDAIAIINENVDIVETADTNTTNQNTAAIDIQKDILQIENQTEYIANNSDSENDESCPICMDEFTNSGEHRICCLRCGHLFGHSCILRWLQTSCTSATRRCPQCNKKAAVRDIRMLYAKRLKPVDTTEVDKLKKQLSTVIVEKNMLEIEIMRLNTKQKLYDQQLASMKERIKVLESQTANQSFRLLSHNATMSGNKKFHLERSIEICKDDGCRVLDYNPSFRILVASQKSTNNLFPGYGIKIIDAESFQLRQFICLHSKAIRDISFHPTQESTLLSVGFDKNAKILNIQNNKELHSYQTDFPLWSCCWSGENPNTFLAGAQNGSIMQFDIRQTSGAVDVMENSGDKSPVVSLAKVPPSVDSGICRGGFIACRLNSCCAYEQRDGKFVSKQIFGEGPFFSVCYDAENNHALISCRPNKRQPNARHIVCTIDKGSEETILCNVVHTFNAGNSQHLLSRPCYIYIENDTCVAAHQESSNSIPVWSLSTGKQIYNISVSDPIVDLCPFKAHNTLFLATLSTKKLRLYNYA